MIWIWIVVIMRASQKVSELKIGMFWVPIARKSKIHN